MGECTSYFTCAEADTVQGLQYSKERIEAINNMAALKHEVCTPARPREIC